jgi:hypothetical protein
VIVPSSVSGSGGTVAGSIAPPAVTVQPGALLNRTEKAATMPMPIRRLVIPAGRPTRCPYSREDRHRAEDGDLTPEPRPVSCGLPLLFIPQP